MSWMCWLLLPFILEEARDKLQMDPLCSHVLFSGQRYVELLFFF